MSWRAAQTTWPDLHLKKGEEKEEKEEVEEEGEVERKKEGGEQRREQGRKQTFNEWVSHYNLGAVSYLRMS